MSDDLGRLIGQLEGRLGAMIERDKIQEKQNAEAAESRKVIHEKLNSMDAKINHMDARLTELEPIVGQFSKWRERGIGVFLFLSFILTAMGALIAVLWDKLLHFIGLK